MLRAKCNFGVVAAAVRGRKEQGVVGLYSKSMPCIWVKQIMIDCSLVQWLVVMVQSIQTRATIAMSNCTCRLT